MSHVSWCSQGSKSRTDCLTTG